MDYAWSIVVGEVLGEFSGDPFEKQRILRHLIATGGPSGYGSIHGRFVYDHNKNTAKKELKSLITPLVD